ncbi:MAG: ABC transporter substrate-binding protein [Dehalococcoidia bacterium]
MRRERRRILLLVLALIAAVSACAQPAPGAVVDNQGREIHLQSIPVRIVSHVPSITETLFALGLGDRVVGVSDHGDFPEEAANKPKVGGYFTPSIEKIVALNPDLVLTDGHPADIAQLDGLGIPYIVLEPEDIDELLSNIELLGAITGSEKSASELRSDMEEHIDAVVSMVKDAPRPRVFYILDATDPTKPWTAGPGSFVDDLLSLAGGENVAGEAQGPWIQFSLEELVASDPEIILVDSMHGTAVMSLEQMKEHDAWREITAVKEDRIGLIDGDLVNRHGPRIVQGLEEMARIIHPELFNQ